MCAYQGVDQVRARTDIKDGSLFRHYAIVVIRQQIGKMMDVIRTARDRRAEKAIRDVPVRHTIKMGQQRFVQRFNRQRIGKVYRRFTGWCLNDKTLQFRAAQTQGFHIVAATVAVTRVQSRLVGSHGILL